MTMLRGLSLVKSLPSTCSRTSILCRQVMTSAPCCQEEGYVAHNKKLGRPLSPSIALLVRNPDPIWIFSIGHRASACVLTPAVSLMSIAYLSSGSTFPQFLTCFEGLYQSPAVWGSVKFMMAFPFTYHCINGIRHLYWDTGRGYTMQFTYRAGYTVLIAAIISAIGLVMYTPGK